MKTVLFLILLIILSTSIFSQNKKNIESYGSLEVNITGIENTNGKIVILLFNSEENLEEETHYKLLSTEIISNSAKTLFKNLPIGEYAIRLYHDEDNDDEIDTNFLGIPTEGYGFSNNVTATFGPPSFEDSKFDIDNNKLSISIEMIY